MRKILSLFTVVFFVFGVFIYGKSSSNHSFRSVFGEDGMVLGVSEEVSAKLASDNTEQKKDDSVVKNNFPPIKKGNNQFYELKNGKAAALDCDSGSVLYSQDSVDKMSIASITKLATALVFLRKGLDLDSVYKVRQEDRIDGGLLHLRVGDLVTIRDLLNLSLVSSDNMATLALVSASGVSREEFVSEMNVFAKENGLADTIFVDTVGLEQNLSTTIDVARLANLAFANKVIVDIVARDKYIFRTKNGREVIARSTNILLDDKQSDGVKILGGKTGFTNSAGYCFVGKFVDKNNNCVISVILNDSEKSSRFYQARNLAKWVYDNFVWNN